MQETVQTIKVLSLYTLPANVTSPTKKIIDQYANIASTCPQDLPVIEVGKVNGKHYIITHNEVHRACKQIGLSDIQANVTEYDTLTDAVVQHVRKNKDPSSFDPLLVRDAIDFLGERGIDESKAIRMFLLNNTETEKILRLALDEKTIKKLRQLNEYLSEKLTSVFMPSYIPAKVAKIPVSKQSIAVEAIKALIMMETISDAKFAWPNPDVIDVTLSEFAEKMEKNQEVKIADVVTVAEISENHLKEPAIKPSKKTAQKAASLAKTFSNVLYIEGDRETHRKPMIVNTKTGRAAEIKNKNKVLTLVGNLGSDAFVFPDAAAKHLDLGNDGNAFMKKFSNVDQLQTILNNAKKKKINLSGVIFTNNRL